jgi:hypothetical protein
LLQPQTSALSSTLCCLILTYLLLLYIHLSPTSIDLPKVRQADVSNRHLPQEGSRADHEAYSTPRATPQLNAAAQRFDDLPSSRHSFEIGAAAISQLGRYLLNSQRELSYVHDENYNQLRFRRQSRDAERSMRNSETPRRAKIRHNVWAIQ